MKNQPELVAALIDKGVVIHAPAAVVICDIDPARVEAGVEIFPGATVCGMQTLLRTGTRLGLAGGGFFRNIACGRQVELYSGFFEDAVFLDGAIIRGHAEVRGGTLLEEGAEASHHVGYKMTICMPNVVAGSLINFCDAMVSGGTSRRDHSEIGSTLALYNFTPWGDKFASLFGDVPRGVFLRQPRIFIGGQTQIVSPVSVGFGTLIPAGAALRRSVGDGQLAGEASQSYHGSFDPDLYGGLLPKFKLSSGYVGNLWALLRWYEVVREAWAQDALEVSLYEAAQRQIEAGVAERIKRLKRIVERLPVSRSKHLALIREEGDLHSRRAAEHQEIVQDWPKLEARLRVAPEIATPALEAVASRLARLRAQEQDLAYVAAIHGLEEDLVEAASAELQAIVDRVVG